MAAWKIDGFVVTPTTCRPATSSARLPEVIRRRDRSSSQIDTPWSDRRPSASEAAVCSVTVIIFLVAFGSCARGGQRGAGRGGDVLGGEAVLGEQGPGIGGGTEVIEGDDPSCVTCEAVPRQIDARLDGDPGPHRRRQ